MKITKKQLKRIIQEEIKQFFSEGEDFPGDPPKKDSREDNAVNLANNIKKLEDELPFVTDPNEKAKLNLEIKRLKNELRKLDPGAERREKHWLSLKEEQ